MNTYLKECWKHFVKSLVGCSHLALKPDVLSAMSCTISVIKTFFCVMAVSERLQMEIPEINFRFPKRNVSAYTNYRERFDDEDLPDLNTRVNKNITMTCPQCQSKQSLQINAGKQTIFKCKFCGYVINFSTKNLFWMRNHSI